MQKLADFFAVNYPELKGFNRHGLYRMKQFYELYANNEKVSPLVTQLSWTNHLKIMSACKSMEERIFYMNICIKERLSKRELERQIDSGYYERYMLSQKPLTPAIEESRRATGHEFAVKWCDKFRDKNINYIELVDHFMADDCAALGFEMDCGLAFSEKYGRASKNHEVLERIIDDVTDIPLRGSAIYSQWRYFNYWAYDGAAIGRRKEIEIGKERSKMVLERITYYTISL